MKMSEKLYNRYSFLAVKYANKVFSYHELSFTYEDLLQEFRIKIFSSIKSYGKRWLKYKNEGYAKPVPIRYYLEAACSNKVRDFIKYISRENNKLRIDDINYDFGMDMETQIIPESNKFIINGVDLLDGLCGKDRLVFSLFLKGYSAKILNKVYTSTTQEKKLRNEVVKSGDEPFNALDLVDFQKSYLITKYGNELTKFNKVYQKYELTEN